MLSEKMTTNIAETAYTAVAVWENKNGMETPAWADIDQVERDAVVARVNDILRDPRAGDAIFHNKWMASMKEEGWTEGKVYSASKKIDPLLVSFHTLPPIMQTRARMFRAVVVAAGRV